MKKTFHFVYLTVNLVNGKKYIGDHSTNNLNDGYIGSGRPYFKNALNQYGKENFKCEILEFFDSKEHSFNAQEKYIKQYNTLVPNGYNISPKGGLRVKGCHSEETKKKISVSNTGKKRSEEVRKQNGNIHRGMIHNKETIEKIKIALKGHKVSIETKEKISKSHAGKSKYWLIGKPRSENIKEKIRKTKKEKPFVYTEEIRLKMSNAKKGKTPWNKGLKFTRL